MGRYQRTNEKADSGCHFFPCGRLRRDAAEMPRESAMATSMRVSLASVLMETFRTLKKDCFDPYRPELHYMRGPGPKWHEKHALRLAPLAVRVRPARVSRFRPQFP
jgi:hypothetical protein